MPHFCAVMGCSNRSNRETTKKFFSFPSVRDRRGRSIEGGLEKRTLWIKSLHRQDFHESKISHATVCSDHFISGYPSDNPEHPDFVPSVNMGYRGSKRTVAAMNLYKRNKRKNMKSSSATKEKDLKYENIPDPVTVENNHKVEKVEDVEHAPIIFVEELQLKSEQQ